MDKRENNMYDNENYERVTIEDESMYKNDVNFVMLDYKPKNKQNKKGIRKFLGTVSLVLVSAILGGSIGGYVVYSQRNNISYNNTQLMEQVKAQNVNISLTDDVYFAAAVAAKNQKTVVGITVEIEQQINTFWGPQTQRGQSMGSGFIVDSNGYILTNSHVVGDGEYNKISVSLIDGTSEVGEVLWFDQNLDLAMVKINRTGLPVVEFGDSDKLLVGEPAVAIGNPMTLDLERTVTQGIISGLNRTIVFENGTVIEPLIQTDASINSGNSGGPLFNAKGEVIGINTAKMTTAEGLGFSIPINVAKPIIEQIIKTGKFSTVYLGIKGVDVEAYKRALGVEISAENGIVIVEVIKDSPAYKAKIQSGDIITSINGNKIDSMSNLKKQLYGYKENEKIQVTIIRNGEELNIEITLQQQPENY